MLAGAGDREHALRAAARAPAPAPVGPVAVRAQDPGQQFAGVRFGFGRAILGAAGEHQSAAAGPALGAQVDHPVGALDHVRVVLDHQYGVAAVDQPVQDRQQVPHVGEVQAGGGLVQDVERAPGGRPGQFAGELDALGLAAGKRGGRLSQLQVAEADVHQRLQDSRHRREVGKELQGVVDPHRQDIGDALTLVADLQRLAVEAPSFADLADDLDVAHELHLDLAGAAPLAGLAAPAADVEGKAARRESARARLGELREKAPDVGEDPGIGRRVGPRVAADRTLVDLDDLVDRLHALQAAVRTGGGKCAVQLLRQRPPQHVVDQRGLARSRDPGDRNQGGQREFHVQFAQIVGRRAQYPQARSAAGAAAPGSGDLFVAAQECPGQRTGFGKYGGRRAAGHDLPAVVAGPGPEINNVVGGAYGRFVVLDNHDRVAPLAQCAQGLQQSEVVLLVQADRGLVENVEHTLQARTDLGRQANALSLAAGQRRGATVEIQVPEADLDQKLQPGTDLAHDRRGDLVLAGIERQPAQLLSGLGYRQGQGLGDISPAQPHRQRLGPQARPGAGAAGLVTHVGKRPTGDVVAAPTTVAQDRQDPPPGPFADRHPPPASVAGGAVDALGVLAPASAAQDKVADLLRQLVPGGVDREAERLAQRFPAQHVHAQVQRPAAAVGQRQRAVGDGTLGMGDQLLGVKIERGSQSVAGRAGTAPAVERKQRRFRRLDPGATTRTAVAGTVHRLLVPPVDQQQAVGELERGLDRPGDAVQADGPDRDPVHDHVNVVPVGAREVRGRIKAHRLAIDPGPDEAAGAQSLHQFAVLAAPVPDYRRQQQRPGLVRQVGHPLGDLLGTKGLDLRSAGVAVELADPGVEEPQEIGNLGDGPDGRAGVAAGALLIDRRRRGQPFDVLDLRSLQLAQKLARIAGQGLDVAALTFLEYRVECQRRLARPADPGEYGQRLVRYVQVHRFEVVLTRAANRNGLNWQAAELLASGAFASAANLRKLGVTCRKNTALIIRFA